jgi:hypothetical protein
MALIEGKNTKNICCEILGSMNSGSKTWPKAYYLTISRDSTPLFLPLLIHPTIAFDTLSHCHGIYAVKKNTFYYVSRYAEIGKEFIKCKVNF